MPNFHEMTKRRYHNFDKPINVLITGNDRRQCLHFFKLAGEIFAENAPPLGDQTNLRSYKEGHVFHLVIDNLQEIRFTLDFEPSVSGTIVSGRLKDCDLAIYCSRFEEPRGDVYNLLTNEIEKVLIEFLPRTCRLMIVIANAGAIFERAAVPTCWPEMHQYLMNSLSVIDENPPTELREGGLQVLESLAALVDYYSEAGRLFKPVEIFNFTDVLAEGDSYSKNASEWLLQFMHLLFSLDKTYRYKYLTFEHLYG
jgi:hypothetical protein